MGSLTDVSRAASLTLVVASLTLSGAAAQVPPSDLLGPGDLGQLQGPAPDLRIQYAAESALQFGQLRLPTTDSARHQLLPVIVFIHGGCWLSQFDIAHVGALEVAFAEQGYAVWSLEYRRVGDPGGGWPGTFLDIADGLDHLRELAHQFPLDLEQVIVAGHSAGGQLALWAAARSQLEPDSDLYRTDPLPVRGVLALAPAPQLDVLQQRGVCGNVIDKLMGGSVETHSERYGDASPLRLDPIEVPVAIVVGDQDHSWKSGSEAYAQRFANRIDLRMHVVAGAGHFEVIAPATTAFETVVRASRALIQANRLR